jgi:hypothetical protein
LLIALPEMGHVALHFFLAAAAQAAGQFFLSTLTVQVEGQPFFSVAAAQASGQLFFSALAAHAAGQLCFSAAAVQTAGHFAAHPPPSALAAEHAELFEQDAFFSSALTPHVRPTTRRTAAPTETHFAMSHPFLYRFDKQRCSFGGQPTPDHQPERHTEMCTKFFQHLGRVK